jgi:hypothetical protein
MSKKNLYIIIISALAIFLLLVGFLLFINFLNKQKINISTTTPKVSVQTGASQPVSAPIVSTTTTVAIGPLGEAQKSGDVAPCLSITKVDYKNQCVLLLAMKLANKNLCDNISDAQLKLQCVDQANEVAAIQGNKMSLCLDVVDPAFAQACIIGVVNKQAATVKLNDCEVLPADKKQYCTDVVIYLSSKKLFASAKSKQDCQNIPDGGLQQDCVNKFWNQ